MTETSIEPTTTQTRAIETAQPHPLMMLQSMIDRGTNPEALGQMMSLVERWKATESSERYAEAIHNFQAEVPRIFEKDKTDRFAFASYETIMEAIGPTLRSAGLSIQFTDASIPVDGQVRVSGYIGCGTHREPIGATVRVPAELRVNDSQKDGAAMSFGKRYALILALNLPIVAVRVDAPPEVVNKSIEAISLDQVTIIEDLLTETRSDRKKFLDWVGVASLGDMPKAKFAKAVSALKAKQSTK